MKLSWIIFLCLVVSVCSSDETLEKVMLTGRSSNSSIYPLAKRYCNPPNEISEGEEGKPPVNASLELVAVVIRHGDRGPLRNISNLSNINCGSNSSILLEYLRTLKQLRGSYEHLSPFNIYSLHAEEESQCKFGNLTLLGAHQHLMNGQVLQKSYKDWHGLLGENWTSEHIRLISTNFSRTFQSAVALLYGFLPSFDVSKLNIALSSRENFFGREIPNIGITPTPDVRFCMTERYCECPLLQNLETLVEEIKGELLHSRPAVLDLLQRLDNIIGPHPHHSHPFGMLDSLMAYVCHGSDLPCIPGSSDCVTFENVRDIIEYLDWEGGQLVRNDTYTKTAKLKMFGMLTHLVEHIKGFINGKKSARFLLFSGHDFTLEPLSTALGFANGSTIPYASRLVIELYNQRINNESKYVVKFIYNGKDMTKDTSFCKSYFEEALKLGEHRSEFGICPFEAFRKFVEEDYFLSMGAKSFSAACDS